MAQHRKGRPGRHRKRLPDAAKPRSQRRDRWTGGQAGRGLYLPIAEGLDERDIPRLEELARRQMELNRRRIGE